MILSDGGIYLAFYAALALLMLIELFYEDETVSRWLARAGALAIALFVGLRWQTGTDWDAYLNIFYTNATSFDYDSVVFGIDKGYILFNRLIYHFTSDFSLFLVVDSFIAVGLVYYLIEKSTKFPCMGVYLFYTSYVVTHFMGSSRRMLAIGLVCLSYSFLRKEGRLLSGWPKWAIPFGLAASIHRTSLAAVPGLVVSRRAWPTTLVVLGLLACLGLGISGAPFAALAALGQLLSKYTGIAAVSKLVFYTSGEAQLDANFDVVRQAILGVAKRSTILIIFITYMHFQRPSEYAQRLYNIYIVGCGLYFLMIGAPIFQIISTYYSIVEIALLPVVFYQLPQLKVPYTLYLLAMPFLLLLSALIPYLQLYVPYRSIFTAY
jgi:hypothetical protein